jgi:hypothetical protein
MAKKNKSNRAKPPAAAAPNVAAPVVRSEKKEKVAAPPPKAGAREGDKGAEKKKRALAAQIESPSIITPALIWAGVFAACYIAAGIDEDLNGLMMWIAGVATILFSTVTPIYRNRRQLTKGFAQAIVYGLGVLSLAIGVYAVWASVDFGRPVTRGEIHPGEKLSFKAPGSRYRLFIHGFFPPPTEEEPEKIPVLPGKKPPKQAARPTTYSLTGNYSVRVSAAADGSVVQDFSDVLKETQGYRKMYRRGKGYVHMIKTTKLEDLILPKPGEYLFSVVTLDSKLEQKLEYAVYEKRQFWWPIFIVGFIASLLLGLIDHLMRPLRVDSYFAVFAGVTYGFAGYLTSSALPDSPFSSMAVAILVGFVVGGSLGYAVFMAAAKLYDGVARKYRLSLT